MASGDTIAVLKATSVVLPTTAPAALDLRAGDSGAQLPVLLFDDATDENADWLSFMHDYAGGGLTLTLMWVSDATTGNVVWNAALKSITDDADDWDTKAYAAVNAVTATTATAAGEFDYADITFTDGADMDSIANNEAFGLRITRDADNASDTLSGDAGLVAVRIRET